MDVYEGNNGDGFDGGDSLGSDDEVGSRTRVCLACGGSGAVPTAECEHTTVASLMVTTAVARAAIARLRAAAVARRQAERALRTFVEAEQDRGRAELFTEAPRTRVVEEARSGVSVVVAPFVASQTPTPVPCPRCAERDAEATDVMKHPLFATDEAARAKPKASRGRKGGASAAAQSAFAFAVDAAAESVTPSEEATKPRASAMEDLFAPDASAREDATAKSQWVQTSITDRAALAEPATLESATPAIDAPDASDATEPAHAVDSLPDVSADAPLAAASDATSEAALPAPDAPSDDALAAKPARKGRRPKA